MRYKTLTVPTPSFVDYITAKRVADSINGEFRPGLTIDITNQGAVLQLGEVDVDNFAKFIEQQPEAEAKFTKLVLDRIVSVKSYGLRSGRRVFVDYNNERKVVNRRQKEKARTPHFYSKSFSDENQALPKKFRDKILKGDSEAVLSGIPDNSVDLIFTSPPYNFGLDYAGNESDAGHWEKYFAKLEAVWDQCIRVLKHGGRIGVNVQPLYSDYVPSHHFVSQHFIRRGCIWKGEIIWEKNNYNCKYTAWGSWKSPASPYLKYSWEFIELFCKGSLRKDGAPADADISADDFKKWVYGKWSIAPERNMKELGHPAMFPVALAERMIQLFSFRGDVVLDPFVGAGTTCVAAKQLGRRYVGIDISEDYCAAAKKRLAATEGSML